MFRFQLFPSPDRHRCRLYAGMRVGILGGSFNPPHAGHLHVAEVAMQKLDLDCIWWMVTPQNPLKSDDGLLPFERRFEMCRELVQSPRMVVSDIEQQYGTRCSYDTARNLLRDFPQTKFVWIGGTDLAEHFHKWEGWRELLHMMPFCFIHRPPSHLMVKRYPMSLSASVRHLHVGGGACTALSLQPDQVFWVKDSPGNRESSTRLRSINVVKA